MTVVFVIAAALFGVGAIGAAVRLVRGPSLLDRAVALDVLLAVVTGVIVLIAAIERSATTLVIGVVVALLGFIGSAGLAKLLPGERQ
ncbi:cation:proton antiporter [Nakamurella sp. YIM 132087]|uniref:Cation:proton antiporter n=1 Tax=Nakamurella alba TaxID=2665158 RepID=A0A7K1FIJ2_9ACTN|nr:monovalent cation/H+ antiporter complex subunit F [Nakamurella alba]MTD13269.1 cation:proton antiporter [Nakamurella alba]